MKEALDEDGGMYRTLVYAFPMPSVPFRRRR